MIRLLLETATDVCSVAVARDNEILAAQTSSEPHRHSSHLTLYIRQIMTEAGLKMENLNEVVLSDGPGSYTSLRVGAATAKGLCLALPGLKLRVVPTLTALAWAAEAPDRPVLATINSRRGEVFGQLFSGARPPVQGKTVKEQGTLSKESPLIVGPTNIRLTEDGWFDAVATAAGSGDFIVCGGGQDRLTEHLPAGTDLRTAAPAHCSAIYLLAPATSPATSRIVDVATYEPFYLNPPFVTRSKKKLLG